MGLPQKESAGDRAQATYHKPMLAGLIREMDKTLHRLRRTATFLQSCNQSVTSKVLATEPRPLPRLVPPWCCLAGKLVWLALDGLRGNKLLAEAGRKTRPRSMLNT